MKKTQLVWRLKEQPTAEALQNLVNAKIITKEEAKQILLSSEEQEDRDKNSLKSEIKFLRELVEKLSKSRSEIRTTIKEIEIPVYRRYPWWETYSVWCNTDGNDFTSSSSGDLILTTGTNPGSFSDIQTF